MSCNKKDSNPLVTVGIPTYNRPVQLKAALESILNQTYTNLEIVVSENASLNSEVLEILNDFSRRDSRVSFVIQESNLGALGNFAYVAEHAKGEFFMWAADDDLRDYCYIENCVKVLNENQDIVAVSTEVQYSSSGLLMPLFPQGAAYYELLKKDRLARLSFALKHGVDNIAYAIFRKEAILTSKNKLFWGSVGMRVTSEMPLILYAAYYGEIVILKTPGFIKSVSKDVYSYVRWETCGGKIPKYLRVKNFKAGFDCFEYHFMAAKDISKSIDLIPVIPFQRCVLKSQLWYGLFLHLIQMVFGYKPARKYVPKEFHG